MATPRVHEKRRSRISRSPRGVTAQSLTSNSSVRLTVKLPGVAPPIRKPRMLPAASSPRSEIAISVPASGCPFGGTARHSRPLLFGSVLMPGGTAIGWPRARRPSRPIVEAHDLVHALDADIERAAVLGERLGVVPAAPGERPAVRAEHRRHLGVGDRRSARRRDRRCGRAASGPCRSTARKRAPSAPTRNDGDAAEVLVGRGQHQAAAELQRAEAACARGRADRTPRSAAPGSRSSGRRDRARALRLRRSRNRRRSTTARRVRR